MHQRKHFFRFYLAETSGSVSMLFGLLAMVFIGFIGIAVDYGRWNDLRARTSDALDAALLAGARTLQTEQSESAAISTAEKNFLSAAKGKLNMIDPKVLITLVDNGAALEAVAWGKIKTPFLGFVKTKSLKVAAKSRVAFSAGGGSSTGGSDLEIAMMLDVTGSMCADGSGPCSTSPKMDALKLAANDLVNIILKNAGSGTQSARIALVPFSTRVRVGAFQNNQAETLMKKLTDLPATWSGWYATCPNSTWIPPVNSESSGTWSCGVPVPEQENNWSIMPCVTDRTGPAAATDDAPGNDNWLNAHGGDRSPWSWDSSNTAQSTETGNSSSDPADHWNFGGDCDGIDEKDIVMPLTSDKTALSSRIDGLVAYGATAGTLGTSMSWYMLSPNWNNIWNGQSQPGAYEDTVAAGSNPPKLRKIAVLMTDGMYNTTRGWMDQDPVAMATNAKQVCANMKAKGIEIYTVGFDLDSLGGADRARATDTLQSCGSDLSHFYDALSAEQLKQSFRDIAMQLSQIFVAR